MIDEFDEYGQSHRTRREPGLAGLKRIFHDNVHKKWL